MPHRAEEPIYFGCKFKPSTKQVCCSGAKFPYWNFWTRKKFKNKAFNKSQTEKKIENKTFMKYLFNINIRRAKLFTQIKKKLSVNIVFTIIINDHFPFFDSPSIPLLKRSVRPLLWRKISTVPIASCLFLNLFAFKYRASAELKWYSVRAMLGLYGGNGSSTHRSSSNLLRVNVAEWAVAPSRGRSVFSFWNFYKAPMTL